MTHDRDNRPKQYHQPGTEPRADIPQCELEGHQLGTGVVRGYLGEGGMAQVYKIWNERLEVFRAIKMLQTHDNTNMMDRFETEAKITAKLHHPNIVEVYNVGEWENCPYLEMEYIDGVSLDVLIDERGKLPDVVCCAIALCIAKALAYAHTREVQIHGEKYRGIIHRDLKPANIMISNHGEVKLMDFGIARPAKAGLHTAEGTVVGTFQYLSPEQLDNRDVDFRTDIYSFGAILYEMLSGSRAFPQDTMTDLLRKKSSNEFRKLAEYDFPISSILSKITQKCMRLKKVDRYDGADDLIKELEAVYDGMTSEKPEAVVNDYLTNSSAFNGSSLRKKKSLVHTLVAAGAVIAIGMVVWAMGRNKGESVIKTNGGNSREIIQIPAARATQNSFERIAEKLESKSVAKLKSPATPTPESAASRPVASRQVASRQVASRQVASKPVASKQVASKQVASKPVAPQKALQDAQQALTDGNYKDAIKLLKSIPSDSPFYQKAQMLLFVSYVKSNSVSDAQAMIGKLSSKDADIDLHIGILMTKTGKPKDALDYFQNSLTKPSDIRKLSEIRNDALFQIALVWSSLYDDSPGDENRAHAVNAWKIVGRMYEATPQHVRYKRALEELQTMK
ncbi:MAG: protein kinase domain-containing protein [Chitinispirillaceae bacterium]